MSDKNERQFYNELYDYFGNEEIILNRVLVDALVDRNNIIGLPKLLKRWEKEGKCQIIKDSAYQIEAIVLIN
jgi:hypothetical protein